MLLYVARIPFGGQLSLVQPLLLARLTDISAFIPLNAWATESFPSFYSILIWGEGSKLREEDTGEGERDVIILFSVDLSNKNVIPMSLKGSMYQSF